MRPDSLREKILAAHRNGIKTVLIPKENRKDLKDIPRRVLRALRIVLVDHMDEVLREALKLADTEAMFGPRTHVMEYRNGEFYSEEPNEAGESGPLPSEPPPAQPGLSG